MISGILNIKKEPGFTSHDVVAKLRGIVHQKKIGHTGTLDPDATGVLPVCLGKATKLCDIIGDWDKTYEAVLLLGRETDTEDTSGQTLKEREVTVTEEEIRDIILSFQGSYDQIPPMYSAKKVNGKKLYELARQGIVIERKPCPVTLSSIIIKKIDLPYVTFEVTCSKGTYIRSLCRDIGEKAGCGGCMAGLVRTRVSSFKIEDGFTLSEVEAMRDADTLLKHIVPVDEVFLHLPAPIGTFDRFRCRHYSTKIFTEISCHSFLVVNTIISQFQRESFQRIAFCLSDITSLAHLLKHHIPATTRTLIKANRVIE